VSRPTATATNVGGLALLSVSGALAANFLREQAAAGLGLLSGAVLAFGIVLTLAMIVLLAKYAREQFGGSGTAVEPAD